MTNTTAAQPLDLDRNTIREIFMRHGFTIKDGQTDLKPYVYEAAEALIAQARTARLDTTASASTSQVGCERDDGLLNIHAESETCEVCAAQPVQAGEAVDTILAEFDRLSKILKVPGYCAGTRYSRREALAMALASFAPVAAQQAAAKAEIPAGASVRDMLRWSQANTDYHGLIAFTQAQFDHFVSMIQAAAKAPAAQAEQMASITVSELADLVKPGRIEDYTYGLVARVVAMAIRKAPPDEALMFQMKRLQVALPEAHRNHISRAIAWHEAGRVDVPVRALIPSAASPASTPEASQQGAAVAEPSDVREFEPTAFISEGCETAILATPEVAYYMSFQSPSFEKWESGVKMEATKFHEFHFKIGEWEWEGSLRKIATALSGTSPATAAAATTSEDARDAARYRWLVGAWTEDELRADVKAERQPAHRPQIEVISHLASWYLPKSEADGLIDSAMRATQQEGE